MRPSRTLHLALKEEEVEEEERGAGPEKAQEEERGAEKQRRPAAN